jgi:hypothetical protein
MFLRIELRLVYLMGYGELLWFLNFVYAILWILSVYVFLHVGNVEVIPNESIQTTFWIQFQEINSVYGQTRKLEMNWFLIDSIPTNSISKKVILGKWFNCADTNLP